MLVGFCSVWLLSFQPDASLIHPPKHTCPHPYTRCHTAVSYNNVDAGLAIIFVAASRRRSAWHIPSSARQQRVSHDDNSARYPCHFPNNRYACSSFGGPRLSALPRTKLWRPSAKSNATTPVQRGFEAHEDLVDLRRAHKAKSFFPPAFDYHKAVLTPSPPTAAKKEHEIIQSTRLTRQEGIPQESNRKKNPVGKGSFRLTFPPV